MRNKKSQAQGATDFYIHLCQLFSEEFPEASLKEANDFVEAFFKETRKSRKETSALIQQVLQAEREKRKK
ncbi:hypothetical protein D929_00169 [Enterococcus faecalis 02-MB-P-10]|uniref:hypothetical protein n=1 Tax=Enterococcus faecalis TaxID=1351 RepID=UPI0003539E6E|nr:hypothetical protein [Enterococcus faecalis]EPH77100.1 hypothetical protein D929_00169 [Enterococcus faecalis 02-MB-P-10]